jgi:hypothetical protein
MDSSGKVCLRLFASCKSFGLEVLSRFHRVTTNKVGTNHFHLHLVSEFSKVK